MKLENKANLSVPEIGQLTLVHDRNVLSVDENMARCGLAQGSYDLQKCCFAGAAGSNNRVKFTGRNFQINALQHLKFAKRFGYFLDFYQLRAGL
jgi:hypothetical protein